MHRNNLKNVIRHRITQTKAINNSLSKTQDQDTMDYVNDGGWKMFQHASTNKRRVKMVTPI